MALEDELAVLAESWGHLGVEAGPPRSDGRAGRWVSAAIFRDGDAWPDLSADYAAGLGTGRATVGGSCALQGHAARVAALAIGHWTRTADLLDLDVQRTWFRVDGGRTTGVTSWSPSLARRDVSVHDVVEALVDHLTSVVEACRSTTRLTSRVAWGNVVTGCVGVFRAVHAQAPPDRRLDVERSARLFVADPSWPAVGLVTVPAASGAGLIYRRHTCCLMRLAPDKRECGSCSRLTDAEQDARWSVAAPLPTSRRTTVGAHVGR